MHSAASKRGAVIDLGRPLVAEGVRHAAQEAARRAEAAAHLRGAFEPPLTHLARDAAREERARARRGGRGGAHLRFDRAGQRSDQRPLVAVGREARPEREHIPSFTERGPRALEARIAGEHRGQERAASHPLGPAHRRFIPRVAGGHPLPRRYTLGVRALVLAIPLVAVSAVAAAQDAGTCVGSDLRAPLEITPAVGAPNVTLGAPIEVRYPPGYFDDPVIGADPTTSIVVFEGSESGPMVTGRSRAVGDILVFTPDEPFAPGTIYVGTAFGLDADFPFNFRTGSSFDLMPPVAGSVLEMTATKIEEDSCDATAGSYRIDVSFEGATDDGPPGDIEYLLYLSRGPEVDAPQLRARLRNQSAGNQIMAFIAEPSEIASPVCVSVVAVDGVGNVDDSATPLCDDPIQGSFFEPLCSASPGRTGDLPQPVWALALLALVLRRRVRPRR